MTMIVSEGEGATPFTIVVAATPRIRSFTGAESADPIIDDPRRFDDLVQRLVVALFAGMPDQTEVPLGSRDLADRTRVVSLHSATPSLALVEDVHGLSPRRAAVEEFLHHHRLEADVAFVVSALNRPEAAIESRDAPDGGGVAFTYHGGSFVHCHRARSPGIAALNVFSDWRAIVHELQHALGSEENLGVADLYQDVVSAGDVVNKQLRPNTAVPAVFADLDGVSHDSDPDRAPIGYPPTWRSFHCARHQPAAPALMDDYRQAPVDIPPEHDTITREFIRGRLCAKIFR